MKNVITIILFFSIYTVSAQPIVQPISSGDYWRIEEYNRKLRQFADQTRSFPAAVTFPSGHVGVSNLWVNRLTGANEIHWTAGNSNNVSFFLVEYSRDNRNFERAGQVNLLRTENGTTYVFRHPFNDDRRVYYRIAIANANNQVVAYTPAVQVLEEEHTVKIFPTQVRGGNFYIQTGQPYEKLQVVNSANQSVYEKGINNVTGTINISLPSLPTGIYFVRLLSPDRPQHVQRIMVE